MRVLGEICLLVSLVATGFAAILAVCRGSAAPRPRRRLATYAALVGFGSLTITIIILVWALVSRDFRFEYVGQYASRLLPWRYCFSALWVGQAGSLLLWAWMMGLLAMVLGFLPAADTDVRDTAFGLVLGNVCFLVVVMVFAADPMAPSLILSNEGAGLSPLLQHPSMLVHPPIVFLSYAAWSVPCALAVAALWHGRSDASWTRMARPWAVWAWMILGVGLLLGANWAYQELGWGGYWGWDPVENGSLMPWLTGTAFIHCLMTWRNRGRLKKTAVALAILTFGLCNFATFLTRSGIFSSVHAFSESPIGWMFLALMSALIVGGSALLMRERTALRGERLPSSVLARETFVLVSVFLLLLLTAVVLVGTLVAPLSRLFTGRMIQIGPEFYNNVLPPIGLGMLAMTAAVPLLRWGAPPTASECRLLGICLVTSLVFATCGFIAGVRHPVALAVVGLAALAPSVLLAACWQYVSQRPSRPRWKELLSTLSSGRRRYAAYCIHLGFVCVAIGVAGSSLGTRRQEFTLAEGDVIEWEGRQIHYVRLEQRQLPDKLVAEAVLEVARFDSPPIELRPARHLHLLQNQWTTEVAIHSTWGGDFYTILNAGLGDGRVAVTLVNNPMIRWIWLGGYITTASAIVAVWPSRRRRKARARTDGAAADQLAKDEVARQVRAA
jgi:cytochrome c-type biogenesis protein CcmF